MFCAFVFILYVYQIFMFCHTTTTHTRSQAWLLPAVVVVTSNFYPPPFIPSLSSAQKDDDDDDDDEVEDKNENGNDADTSALEQQLTCKSLYILSVHVCAAAIVLVRVCVCAGHLIRLLRPTRDVFMALGELGWRPFYSWQPATLLD